MRISHWALLVVGFALAGCNRGGDRTGQARDSSMMGQIDSGGMGMRGMPMQGTQMMSQMRAHMDSMLRMSPQQMQIMMAGHQSMMSRVMDGMGADMHSMKMAATAEWTALTDSVKQDLAELPNLKGQELSTRMRAHADRVNRLIAMHEKMMGSGR
jgi:hypothetical protein